MYDVHFEIDFLVSFLFVLKYYIIDLIKTCQRMVRVLVVFLIQIQTV